MNNKPRNIFCVVKEWTNSSVLFAIFGGQVNDMVMEFKASVSVGTRIATCLLQLVIAIRISAFDYVWGSHMLLR